MTFQPDLTYAEKLDQQDPLQKYRALFFIPQNKNGRELIYLCGNSLGLQPTTTRKYILEELDAWQNRGVYGHFQGQYPWMPYHEFVTRQSAYLVGARDIEVVIMNSLTVNLHLLMVSFYRPTSKRNKILIEKGAFPSDRYAVCSQIEYHGYEVDKSLYELSPRPGEEILHEEDIIEFIEQHGQEIDLILLGGVNYYTGQLMPMEKITQVGHKQGCKVGFDLAHGVGNVPLQLHDWQVDFAAWCTYKYLNSGPGSVGGGFVHEKHVNASVPRFAGWWGHDKKTRFTMPDKYVPIKGAEGWQLSNAPVLSMASLRASLDIFEQAGIENLSKKSKQLTNYLEFLLREKVGQQITIITPGDQRGAQLSLLLKNGGKRVHELLNDNDVVCDWRDPNVIRVAPVPLYNSFEDVWLFVDILQRVIEGQIS